MSVCGRAQIAAGSIIALGGVPTQRAVTEGAGGEQLDGRLADDLHAVVLTAIEHHLRKHGEIGGGAKQASMTGDTTQCVRVLVMNLTTQRISARRCDFGWRNAVL